MHLQFLYVKYLRNWSNACNDNNLFTNSNFLHRWFPSWENFSFCNDNNFEHNNGCSSWTHSHSSTSDMPSSMVVCIPPCRCTGRSWSGKLVCNQTSFFPTIITMLFTSCDYNIPSSFILFVGVDITLMAKQLLPSIDHGVSQCFFGSNVCFSLSYSLHLLINGALLLIRLLLQVSWRRATTIL